MNFNLKVFFGSIMSILLTYIFLFSSIQVNAFSTSFYKQTNHKLQISEEMNISKEDYLQSMDVLLDYLQGKREDIVVKITYHDIQREMFNQREADHMVDVRNLYLAARMVCLISIAIVLALGLILYFDNKHEFLEVFATSFKRVAVLVVFLLVGLILFAVIDFHLFWNTFHKIFFTNDLWILNYRTDFMIRMLPQDLFFAMVLRIVAMFVALYLGTLGWSVWYMRKLKKNSQ